ncbi:MAG: hypothetical protein AMS16_01895 [Planctomycetes bacterium DG_58]|nr:MAG: hypothetical protein AMS16_01895 [Planctomycetes bacterium DG_58]
MTLELDFKVIPDPTGFAEALLLKGDWVIVCISDGTYVGLGEATHSGDDERCMEAVRQLFKEHVAARVLSLGAIRDLEEGPFSSAPDFLTATAISALSQALYDLVARRNGVPVWQLFVQKPIQDKIELYATINRCLATRTEDEYREVVSLAAKRGFRHFKCAPFDRVTPESDHVLTSKPGLAILWMLRREFPQLGMRIDFHKRFTPRSFDRILPGIARLAPYWIEEPFVPQEEYLAIRQKTSCRLAAGELCFGVTGFRKILENRWVDVVMPDVKHVGGFGAMLEVCALAAENGIEVSPHNPSGPVSTAASMHAAALCPNVTSLEIPFDADRSRRRYHEPMSGGWMHLTDKPGWGIDLSEF